MESNGDVGNHREGGVDCQRGALPGGSERESREAVAAETEMFELFRGDTSFHKTRQKDGRNTQE